MTQSKVFIHVGGSSTRKGSPTFGKWAGVELSQNNHKQLWVPPGFAQGFLVSSNSADLLYKTTDYYAPEHEHERGVVFNDPDIGIQWYSIAIRRHLTAFCQRLGGSNFYKCRGLYMKVYGCAP